MKNLKKSQGGFTLIELITSMVIVGILMSGGAYVYKDLTGAATATKNLEAPVKVNHYMTVNIPLGTNTLSQISTDSGYKVSSSNTGLCASKGFIVQTFKDTALTTPTAAVTDLVLGTSKTSVTDATC